MILLGLVVSGWGAGVLSVHYLIGNAYPLNSINAVGILFLGVGLGMTLYGIIKLKGVWNFTEEWID